jgi:thiosulfate/3-mercaptopyruvate sulfurtransferase
MMKPMRRSFVGLALMLGLAAAWAQDPGPLVEADWVANNACRDDVRVLDIRSRKIDGESRPEYLQAHIPCAVHSDYVQDGWRAKQGEVPGVLPSVAELEGLIGRLGIAASTRVVIAPLGEHAKSMASAARLYWTFKLLGHDRVSILNGGTRGYAADESRAMATGAMNPVAKTFRAQPREGMLATSADVAEAAAAGALLVDYRRGDEYLGINRNPKTRRSGTLQGARNLPMEWLTADNGATLRSPASLRQLLGLADIDANAPQIAFCNTGHNSSLGWFVFNELLGNPGVRLYDGSMAEWSRQQDRPVERQVVIAR